MTIELRALDEAEGPEAEASWLAAGATLDASTSAAPLPPGAQRLVAFRDGRPAARVAFGTREGFRGAPGSTGYVGWYAAADGESGPDVLREAAARLLTGGAERVVGPLDGSTWYRYRVAMPRDASMDDGGPFLSEPRNPPEWAEHFEAAGFRPLLEYETRIVRRPMESPALRARRLELAGAGIHLRDLSLDRYESELRALYDLSVDAFAENPYYTPIPFEEFQRLYAPLRPLLDPSLVRLAVDADGRVLGYVFAFPDALADPARPRIVLKTLAVAQEARGSGLGGVLVDEINRIAAERGASVLHALMQVTNASRSISRRSDSEVFRRYLLYGLVGG